MRKHVEQLVGLEGPDAVGAVLGMLRHDLAVELVELNEVGPLQHELRKQLLPLDAVVLLQLPILKLPQKIQKRGGWMGESDTTYLTDKLRHFIFEQSFLSFTLTIKIESFK